MIAHPFFDCREFIASSAQQTGKRNIFLIGVFTGKVALLAKNSAFYGDTIAPQKAHESFCLPFESQREGAGLSSETLFF